MSIKVPDYKGKQKLLYIQETSSPELVRIGEECLKEEKIADAIDFFGKAQNKSGLEKIAEALIDQGDLMLFLHCLKALGREGSVQEWDRIGRRALELEKYSFAFHAFGLAGNAAMVEETRRKMERDRQS
ncbi:MAG: hypothetical protein PHG91_00195 [Syntrophales bacterium]|nr:hypothetical protein [Syntrophales bacterium]MDD5231788.1 hypothetical protein [Syntrophales bacterium]MDD5531231.1 hypothetical protein [Syntrophales bacterium]HPL63884.1 hypothetical protein [Syntrophales bacterium]